MKKKSYSRYCKICRKYTKFKNESVKRLNKKTLDKKLIKCSECRQYLMRI